MAFLVEAEAEASDNADVVCTSIFPDLNGENDRALVFGLAGFLGVFRLDLLDEPRSANAARRRGTRRHRFRRRNRGPSPPPVPEPTPVPLPLPMPTAGSRAGRGRPDFTKGIAEYIHGDVGHLHFRRPQQGGLHGQLRILIL